MRILEIVIGGSIVISSVTISLLVNDKACLVVMNLILMSLYILLTANKLPHWISIKQEYHDSWENKLSIFGSIGYFFFCAVAMMFPCHLQLFGRIGFVIIISSAFVIIFYTYFRRLFGTLSIDKFRQNHIVYIRCILVFLANIFILPHMTYSDESTYVNGIMTYRLIKDGMDTHETIYIDSLSCFMTISHLTFSDTVIYVKYSRNYEDDALRVDTLPAVGYKVGKIRYTK